ncbi:MAG: ABC transporter permease subunit, partial [bacterium]
MNFKKYLLYPIWFYILSFPFLYWNVFYRPEAGGGQAAAAPFDAMKGISVALTVLACLIVSDLWTILLKPRLSGARSPRALRAIADSVTSFRASKAGRFTSLGIVIALALAALAFPSIAQYLPAPNYQIDVATKVGLYIILALGLNIVVGLAGVLDLGFIAFYAVGAYTWALLASGVNGKFHWNAPAWSYPLVIVLAAFLAGLFRLAIGWPALRLRGDYLAIVTLGFGEVMRYLLTNLRDYTGGSNGINIKFNPSFFGWTVATVTDYYYLVIAFVF